MAEKRGYGQFCPVALATEVLAERWTPLLVREMLCGSVRFNDLQRGVPRMSSALLSQRLKDMEFAGIVERRPTESGAEYHLTDAGRALFPIVEQMGVWAQHWLRHRLVNDHNLDSDLLMWDIRRRINLQALPRASRYVVEFHLSGSRARRSRYWIVTESGHVDICYKDPGFDADLLVESDLATITSIWLGHVSVGSSLSAERLRLTGSRSDCAAFPAWFALSLFAPAAAGQQQVR
jgi:DNA-binding HxlR family transcriptional regulator